MTARLALSSAVGHRLRELRLAAGIPLDRLATQAGLRKRTLLNIEEGSERPTIATLDKLASRLNVSLVDLVTSAGTPRPAARASREGAPHRPVAAAAAAIDGLDGIARAIARLPSHLGDKLEAVELAVVTHALAVCGGNRSAAARLLGIERKAVIRRWVKTKRAKKRSVRGS